MFILILSRAIVVRNHRIDRGLHVELKNMKKYVFLGVIALVMLLVAPAMAVGPSADTVIVQGAITPYLTLTLSGSPTFPAMIVGEMFSDVKTCTVDTSVKYNVAVTATSNYMTTGSKTLSQPFKLWDGATSGTPVFAELPYTTWDSGATTGIHTRDIQFSQVITNADLAGSYSATVLFTATEA